MGVIAIYANMRFFKMQGLQKYGEPDYCAQNWWVTGKIKIKNYVFY